MSNTIGLYIHIPFCRSKCPYCDFFSMHGNDSEYKNYISILKNNISFWGNKINKKVDTIYFGGGTPSVIGADFICEILNCIKNNFTLESNCEITLEANPASGLFFNFNKAKNAGISRISVGLQSANNSELKKLGRIHTVRDAENTVFMIKTAGINNISLDLMLGIPNQTKESLKKSIDFCEKCNVTHISSYILKLEENTVFYKNKEKLNLPDDECTAELYLFALDYLNEKGFYQYEISNFSKKGFESKHNLKYWNLDEYLGIGPSAHSFIDKKRFYYSSSMTDFKNNVVINDGIGKTPEEYIMLQLRLTKGLDLSKYKEVFGQFPAKDFFEKIEKYEKFGLLWYENNIISLTKKGFLVSNTIIADLI